MSPDYWQEIYAAEQTDKHTGIDTGGDFLCGSDSTLNMTVLGTDCQQSACQREDAD